MLEIHAAALEAIRAHAVSGHPLEICGFLVGAVHEDTRQAREAYPVRNSWEDRPDERAALLSALEGPGAATAGEWEAHSQERRYLVSGEDTLAAMKCARSAGLDLVGVYHTHPEHPAIPSDFDRDAAMPEWSYLILSVRRDAAGAVSVAEERSWVLPFGEEPFLEEQINEVGAPDVRIQLPPSLTSHVEGQEYLTVRGATVREALSTVREGYPALGAILMRADGELRTYVNAFRNGEDIRTLSGPDTPLGPGDILTLLPSIAGG